MMIQEERDKTGRLLTTMASYYGRDLQKLAASFMIDDLQEFSYETIKQAFEIYRKNPINKFFPLPSQIIEIIKPSVKEKTTAIALTNKIISKLKDKGSSWSNGFFGELSTRENPVKLYEGGKNEMGYRNTFLNFYDALKDDLGDVAYEYIRNHRGGWDGLCNDYFSEFRNDSSFFAQMREGIESILEISRAGKLNDKPQLPTRERFELTNQTLEILNIANGKTL